MLIKKLQLTSKAHRNVPGLLVGLVTQVIIPMLEKQVGWRLTILTLGVCNIDLSLYLCCTNDKLLNSRLGLEGNAVDCVESLDTFRGYDLYLDPHILYLGNLPAKIMSTIVFDYSTNFSKAFDKFRRALTLIARFLFKCSYLYSS